MKKFTAVIIMIWSMIMNAQNYDFKFFNSELKSIQYKELLDAALESDMVFFGEVHNSTVAHTLQLQLARDMSAAKGKKLVMGAEMFETDNQIIIDEYLAGYFDDSKFEADARIWPNYRKDYRPLLQLAKEKGLKFVATNIPRRYASMVSYGGFEALEKLSAQAKTYIADLPILFDAEVTGYKTMIMGLKEKVHGGIEPENLVKAQAVKDATMAQFILENYNKGNLFYHINGSYHTYNKEGIIWHINQQRKDLKIFLITVVEAESIWNLPDGYKGKADIIIAIPKDSPKSY